MKDRRDDAEIAVERLQRRLWEVLVAQFRAREAQGLKQAHLAARLGVSRPQVNVWLSNPRRLTLRAAARLMWAMDLEIALVPKSPPKASAPARRRRAQAPD
ncbi:helix-turn-helix domain-containing protein [Phenylobacterium sp.]|uniref:helix-turn-helix domain-containing protein n=1 Tax=Phenylobacterium sp. TaxID=1871053 RepID=UPI0035B03DD4